MLLPSDEADIKKMAETIIVDLPKCEEWEYQELLEIRLTTLLSSARTLEDAQRVMHDAFIDTAIGSFRHNSIVKLSTALEDKYAIPVKQAKQISMDILNMIFEETRDGQ